jgi:tRNA modification GTPase
VARLENDTIAAVATGSGGGIGIVRISGECAHIIAEKIVGKKLQPRLATFSEFRDDLKCLIDSGIALFFPAPHSFTGEDVVELQGHGGAVVLDLLLAAVLSQGARQAKPGEFTERAFLNDKIDLVQAEAIADLIAASNIAAARSATNSLQGDFSSQINAFIEALVALRVYIEAALDFPEEEVDFLSSGKIKEQLVGLKKQLKEILDGAQQGALLIEGITVVIAGKPNVGKSSLLNALAGRDIAIVTPIAGTTRDVLRECIQVDGLPLHIIDTAGLRDSNDLVEQEGIRRAKKEIENADLLLLVTDANESISQEPWPTDMVTPVEHVPVTIVRNKCDLANLVPGIHGSEVTLSAKTGAGIPLLKQHLKRVVGFSDDGRGKFSARHRHLDALKKAAFHIDAGLSLSAADSSELLAEELRLAQQNLEVITGRFIADDLLDKIFRDFCIGK